MRSVRLVPPGDEKSSPDDVVVETEDGERFALTVDDALRAALASSDDAGEPADEEPETVTLSSLPSGLPLTPRDIQVRVRGGESPDELATDSGTPIDKIMRFALPVLQERIRVGDEARRSRARRDGDGALVPFGETVDRRFVAHGIDPNSVGWDSFRRPDGSWVVIASWRTGEHERHAHWAFSLAARTVLPADEVGADLLSDRPLRPVVRAVPDHDDDFEPRESVYDQESPSTYVPASTPAVAPAAPPPPPPVLPRHEAPPLPLRLADPLPSDDDTDDADDSDTPAAAAPDADAITGSIGFAELFERNVVEPATAPERPRPARRGKSAREQTKIPSWDDILLGVRRKQD